MDFRADLLMGLKGLAGELELPKQSVQGRGPIFWAGVVGHGMEASLKEMPLPIIKRVETARPCVFFQDNRPLAKTGQADGGGEPGHAAADDNDRLLHQLRCRAA